MNIYFFSIVLIVGSNLFYHLFQKKINININPFFSLIITYIVGIIFSIILYLITAKEKNLTTEFTNINIFTVFLGIAIVGLETGFLLAYRANWSMSIAVILTNVIVTITLIPIGIKFFGESFNLFKIIGIFLCLIGLFFLNFENK